MNTISDQAQKARALGYSLPIIKPSTHPFFRQLYAAECFIAERGIGPSDGTFVTAIPDPLIDPVTYGAPTCQVSGKNAAELVAKGTHRLSTEDEIKRFFDEQQKRDQECAAMTRKMRNESRLELTSAMVEAMNEINGRKK